MVFTDTQGGVRDQKTHKSIYKLKTLVEKPGFEKAVFIWRQRLAEETNVLDERKIMIPKSVIINQHDGQHGSTHTKYG